MRRTAIAFILLGHISGCCGGLKQRVHDFGGALKEQAATSAELVRRCKSGEQPACDAALASIEATGKSADELLAIGKEDR